MLKLLANRIYAVAESALVRFVFGTGAVMFLCLRLKLVDRFQAASLHVAMGYATIGLVLTFCLIAVRAWRWNIILGAIGSPLSAGQLARIYGSSFFLGLVSPGRAGELVRVWMVRDNANGLIPAAFSIAFDRAFDLVPNFLMVGVFAAALSVGDAVTVVRALFVLSGLALVWMLAHPRAMQRIVERVAAKLLRRLHVQDVGTEAEHDMPSIRGRTLACATGISVGSQALAVVQMYFLARAVGIDIGPLVLYGVVSMATLVASLPVSVAGIGTREATVIFALTSLGASTGQAISFSLLWLINFVAMLVISFGFFASRPRHLKFSPHVLRP